MCLIFYRLLTSEVSSTTAASRRRHVPRRRLPGETRQEFSARNAWLMGTRCVPSQQGGQVEAMNKVRRDRSDDVWSWPTGDELAIPCRRKTPITIREAHTLKDRRYFHHFDNAKMESGCDLGPLVLLGAERVRREGLNDARFTASLTGEPRTRWEGELSFGQNVSVQGWRPAEVPAKPINPKVPPVSTRISSLSCTSLPALIPSIHLILETALQ